MNVLYGSTCFSVLLPFWHLLSIGPIILHIWQHHVTAMAKPIKSARKSFFRHLARRNKYTWFCYTIMDWVYMQDLWRSWMTRLFLNRNSNHRMDILFYYGFCIPYPRYINLHTSAIFNLVLRPRFRRMPHFRQKYMTYFIPSSYGLIMSFMSRFNLTSNPFWLYTNSILWFLMFGRNFVAKWIYTKNEINGYPMWAT